MPETQQMPERIWVCNHRGSLNPDPVSKAYQTPCGYGTDTEYRLLPPGMVAVSEERLFRIASIAHAGGISGMTEGDALNSIRRLSIPWWDTIKNDRAAISDCLLTSPAVADGEQVQP